MLGGIRRHLPRLSSRFCCTSQKEKPVFITTPIYYVNDKPHIGHLYTSLLADSLSRWFRMKGKDVFMSTGTDEHGLKVQKSAEAKKISPIDHCDINSDKYKEMFDTFNIKYDRFVRTTEKDHIRAVHSLWETLERNGALKKGSYSGWYCTSDEQFLQDDDVIIPTDGSIPTSKHSGRPVERTEETNILFDLGKYRSFLSDWAATTTIYPSGCSNMVLQSIKKVMDELSVTRDAKRVKWGIPCPSDPSQTLYVWLDALTNYLTVSGYPEESYKKLWPPDYQLIGKDITTFHCIYWPAFLKAAGIPIPKRFICHSHWTRKRVKMSKSIGNIVDPVSCLDTYTVDMMRFYLLLEGGIQDDGDFSFETLNIRVNGDLNNHFGNLFSRSTSLLINPTQIYPLVEKIHFLPGVHQEMMQKLEELPRSVEVDFEDVHFNKGLKSIFSLVRDCNQFFQENTPWKLAKEGNTEKLSQVLYSTYEVLRICSTLLQPIIPDASSKALDLLNVPKDKRSLEFAELGKTNDFVCLQSFDATKSPLFNRIVYLNPIK